MSDIVCSYKIRDTDRSGYFVVDNNINLRQLRQFVSREFFEGARPICIIAKGKGPVKSDEILQEIIRSGDAEFTFVQRSVQDKPMPAVCKLPCQKNMPEALQEEAPEEEKFTLGPNLKKVFSRMDISVDADPSVILQQLQQLPHPLPKLVRRACQGNNSPNMTQRAAYHLSRLSGVPSDDLVPEIRDMIAFVSSAPVKVDSPVVERKVVSKAALKACRRGENQRFKKIPMHKVHQAICDECQKPIRGIRYKCLQCDDFDYCESCEDNEQVRSQHPREHIFAKLHRPRDYNTVQRLKQNRPSRPQPGPIVCGMPPRQFHPRPECKMPRVEALEKSVKELEEQLSQLMPVNK